MSRNWEPLSAGSSAAEHCLETLKSTPKVLLLFSTIHYAENNGLTKLIDGVYSKFSKDIPLVGGTVSGFMTPEGSFTRGVVLLTLSGEGFDVSISVGSDTKRNPSKAVDNAFSNFPKNRRSQRFILSIISGGAVPQFFGWTPKKTIKSKFVGEVFSKFIDMFLLLLQKGVGREDEILRLLCSKLTTEKLLSISTEDNNEMITNFQFLNSEITTNKLICVIIDSDQICHVNTESSLSKTNTRFTVTELSANKRLIKKINGKPAKSEFLRLMNWSEGYIDEKIYRRAFHYPLASEVDGQLIPFIGGLFWGENIYATYQLLNNEVCLLTTSGRDIVQAYRKTIGEPRGLSFVLAAECGIRLEAIGSKVNLEQEVLSEVTQGKKFLCLFVAGEATYSKETGLRYGNWTVNTATVFSEQGTI